MIHAPVKGRAKGGYARAAKLSPERRSEIARIAVAARWAKKQKPKPRRKKDWWRGHKPIAVTLPIPARIIDDAERWAREGLIGSTAKQVLIYLLRDAVMRRLTK